MTVTAERFRFGDRAEGFVKTSEPSPFCGARASDMTNVGSRQHSDRERENDHILIKCAQRWN